MAKEKNDKSGLPSLALVFGYLAVKDLARVNDQVPILSRLGYGNKQIAKICDIPENRVAKIKSLSKKFKKGKTT